LEILNPVLNILKVALGLGFVIFIHELGHFLIAKWNGVKVEKFSIGFGPTLYGFRRGETEYVLAAFPLGGFVKMLGEGLEDSETKSTDPRAYPNKSVSARMAIISAGVVMNVLLAYLCFVYYYQNEREDQPAILGAVAAGSPLYEAGLRPGDTVVSIDGRRDIGYRELLHKVVFSSDAQVLHFQVKRPGQTGLIELDIRPRREANGDRPTIGFVSSWSLKLIGFLPPAGMRDAPRYPRLTAKEREKKVDVLVAAGPSGQPPTQLTGADAYEALLAKHPKDSITHKFERRSILPSGDDGPVLETFELTLPPNHFVDFGLRMGFDAISGIRGGSPAEAAGFRKGDRIVAVDGHDDFNPLHLPADCYEKAGKPMRFEVERELASGQRKREMLTVIPDDTPPRFKIVMDDEPVDLPGIGLCFPVRSNVVAVKPGSPAEKVGIKAGDVIKSMKITYKPLPGDTTPKSDLSQTFEFSDQSPDWFRAFAGLQHGQLDDVELHVNGAPKAIKVMPEIAQDWFNPTRGMQFQSESRKLPPESWAAALRSGYDETIKNILMVYSTFRSLYQRRVSPKHLGGPILIAQVAYGAAGSGYAVLIFFLGVLSINLAVLNFLPIPPLDGGQMVFLIAEKVRGRPLPESALLAGTYFGLFLVVCLMLFVTYQDIFRLVTGG
jgi:regulator of sigma E protease